MLCSLAFGVDAWKVKQLKFCEVLLLMHIIHQQEHVELIFVSVLLPIVSYRTCSFVTYSDDFLKDVLAGISSR